MAPDIYPLFAAFVYIDFARAAPPWSSLQKFGQWRSAGSTSVSLVPFFDLIVFHSPTFYTLPVVLVQNLSSLHFHYSGSQSRTLPAQTDGTSVTPSMTVSFRGNHLLLPHGPPIVPPSASSFSFPFILIPVTVTSGSPLETPPPSLSYSPPLY
ncbi:hypothetical protein R3P38DRAFT_3168867 [Favolaschia claudopus]|uniref:Uncharacterized protein n=1 Tax=Favolaschia claudopus TaxID=2862362 RepID=A0AAW0E0J3_9AGAR